MELSLTFRDGAELDADEISAALEVVHAGLGDKSQQEPTFNPLCWYGKVIVAYHDDGPICVVQAVRNWNNFAQMQLTTASVLPDYQGHGIYPRTLTHLFEMVRADGITQVAAHIPADSRTLFKVYIEQLGFRPQKWVDSAYGFGQDRIYIVKSLDAS